VVMVTVDPQLAVIDDVPEGRHSSSCKLRPFQIKETFSFEASYRPAYSMVGVAHCLASSIPLRKSGFVRHTKATSLVMDSISSIGRKPVPRSSFRGCHQGRQQHWTWEHVKKYTRVVSSVAFTVLYAS
jgi:hypothetical protein